MNVFTIVGYSSLTLTITITTTRNLPGSSESGPSDADNRQHEAQHALEIDKDGHGGQRDDGDEAVSQGRAGGPEVQTNRVQQVDNQHQAQTPEHAEAVDVAKVNLQTHE